MSFLAPLVSRYVPPSSKWAVNVPCEMVKAIANERRPAVDKLGDNIFYKDVVDRLAWFLRVEIPAGEDEDAEQGSQLARLQVFSVQ